MSPVPPAPTRGSLADTVERLSLCAWETTSVDGPAYAAATAAAAAHAEAMQLVTCQRVEAYSLAGCECEAPLRLRLRGRAALAHLAAVAAGLEAAIPGEEQVTGQVRAAAALAPAPIRDLADLATGCARHFRRHERLGGDAGQLLDRGLALLPPAGRDRIIVLGAGHLGRLVARRARHLGFGQVVVAARRPPSPPWGDAAAFTFTAIDEAAGAPADLVVSCLGEGAALDRASLPPAAAYLDLATPRTLRVADAVTIAAIRAAEPADVAARRAALRERLARLLDHRLARRERQHERGVADLRATLESIRRAETARIQRAHPELDEETIDRITRALVNRLFHEPSERLRAIDDPHVVRQFVEIFTPTPTDEVATR